MYYLVIPVAMFQSKIWRMIRMIATVNVTRDQLHYDEDRTAEWIWANLKPRIWGYKKFVSF